MQKLVGSPAKPLRIKPKTYHIGAKVTTSENGQADTTAEANKPEQPETMPKAPTKVPPRKRTTTRRKTTARKTTARKTTTARKPATAATRAAKFPRHSVERALRIPRAILDQNAGHETSPAEAAKFLGSKVSGEFNMEISSAKKYGFLSSEGGKLAVTDRVKRALRPQNENDELAALREAVLDAPDISEVYNHYRGEYLPNPDFFRNALTDRFKIPADKVADFLSVFTESLQSAKLIDSDGDRSKLIDIGREETTRHTGSHDTRTKGTPMVASGTTCFVMQPFVLPYGGYYETVFRPAIEQAGLTPVRADAEIFGAGKVMDQVWRGIRHAKVLVAELTTRNANVYYELGLAHAQGKPVVLIAAEGENVPFDVQHIRVVYYDVNDPFWGQKLIDKIAENIRSALSNPEEAIFAVGD
jgi:hypothetical protein